MHPTVSDSGLLYVIQVDIKLTGLDYLVWKHLIFRFRKLFPVYLCRQPRYKSTGVGCGPARQIAREDKYVTLPNRLHFFPSLTTEKLFGCFGRDLARVVCISPCTANTALSMGIPHFLVSLTEHPDFVLEIMNRYAEWSIRVIRNLKELPVDVFWVGDDLAFGSGPMMSPEHFRKLILPTLKRVVREIRRPWIFHSDGNLIPILEDLLPDDSH